MGRDWPAGDRQRQSVHGDAHLPQPGADRGPLPVNAPARQAGQSGRLKADGDGWIVPSAAAPSDFGLIVLRYAPSGITPIPLFPGSKADLTAALKAADRKVTQSGYPEDHLDNLYSHQDCIVTGWAQNSVLSHQCDTLPGDSGSPLLLKTADGWQVIAVQSSAPGPQDRWRADNRAIAVTGFRDKLEALAGE